MSNWLLPLSFVVRRWAAKLHGVDIATLKPTFSDIKFRFELVNKFKTGDERRLHYWCQRASYYVLIAVFLSHFPLGRVWADFIQEEVAAAREQARLLPPVRKAVPPSTFYGRHWSTFYIYLQKLFFITPLVLHLMIHMREIGLFLHAHTLNWLTSTKL